jgi:hypothetical protein
VATAAVGAIVVCVTARLLAIDCYVAGDIVESIVMMCVTVGMM